MTSVSLKRFDVVDIKILLDYLEEHSLGMPRLWRMIIADDELRKRLDRYRNDRCNTSPEFRRLMIASNLAGDEFTQYLKKGKEYVSGDRSTLSTIWEDDKCDVNFVSLRLHTDVDMLYLITDDENGTQIHWELGASSLSRILLRYPLIDQLKGAKDGTPWIYFFQEGKQVGCTDSDNDNWMYDDFDEDEE